MMRITPEIEREFHLFNAGVIRSRADYMRAPNRACWARDYRGGVTGPCTYLHDDDSAFCQYHDSENRQAARRMKKVRSQRASA